MLYHPAVVHLPIALTLFSVVLEIAGRVANRPALRAAAWYALLGAVIGAAFAVPLGVYDMNRLHHTMTLEIHERVEWHEKVGYATLATLAGLTLWRWLRFTRTDRPVDAPYIAAALLSLTLVLYQGWLGGELVFADRMGVAPYVARETLPAAAPPPTAPDAPLSDPQAPPEGHPHTGVEGQKDHHHD